MANGKITARKIVSSMSERHEVRGSLDRCVTNARPISQADENSLSFCNLNDGHALDMIRNSRAKLIICSNEISTKKDDCVDKTLIKVSNPRLTFSRLLTLYFSSGHRSGVHPTAFVEQGASIGNNVYIGPYCYVGICEIGDDTVLEGYAYVNYGTKIGRRVKIYPGVIIGDVAVSFTRNSEGEMEEFPQLGGVTIEDDVQIGSNGVIQRGPLPGNDTVIGQGTKTGSMVVVGHGSKVGRNCLLVGSIGICGHVKIGDYTQISGKVEIKEGVNIGSRVLVGMGSTVLNFLKPQPVPRRTSSHNPHPLLRRP